MPSSHDERSPLLPSPQQPQQQSDSYTDPPDTNLTREPSGSRKPTRYSKLQSRPRTLLLVSLLLLSAAGVYLYDRFDQADLVDELANSIENLSTCASCKALLVPLVAIAHLGDNKFYSTLVSFCTGLGIQDPEVCRGALGAQAPIIAHSLRSMSLSGQTSTLFCAKTFGLCEDPPVREWKSMPLPPEPLPKSHPHTAPSASVFLTSDPITRTHNQTSWVKTRSPPHVTANRLSTTKPFQVIHLSDLHIDREYTVSKPNNITTARR